MTDDVLDLRRTLAAFRRRWLLLLATTTAGLMCGSLLVMRSGPQFVARSGVLLPPSAVDESGRSLRSTLTEVRIAGSASVLDGVGRSLTPPEPVARLRSSVRVTAVTPDILEVSARAKSATRAAAIADGVAKGYVTYSTRETSNQADVETAALRERSTELNRQISEREQEIASARSRMAGLDPRSPETLRQEALIDSLRAAQLDAARQLSTVNSRIADARLKAELMRTGLRVLEPATRPGSPDRTRLFTAAGIGGLSGMLLAIVLALALEQRDRRLRTRDQIAQSAAAPVISSLSVPRRVRHQDCHEVITRWDPGAEEAYAIRQAFLRLDLDNPGPPVNLVVIAVPGDRSATVVAAKIAVFGATIGTSTALVAFSNDDTTASMRAACLTAAKATAGLRDGLSLHVADDVSEADFADARLAVTLLVAERPLRVPTWGRRTLAIIAVSAGFADSDALSLAALASLEAHHRIRGVVVANPEAGDRTRGAAESPTTVTHDPTLGESNEAARRSLPEVRPWTNRTRKAGEEA